MSEIREWLERLYARSPGYFGITAFAGGKPRRTKWFKADSELDAAERTITANASKADLYLSIGTHESPQKTRGGESTVISIPGLWADLDIGELGHKPASLPNPPTEEAALSIVNDLPEPSMVLHSGGGLQAIWLFDEPLTFYTPEAKAAAKKAIQEWNNLLENRGQLLGYHVDKIADLARILRTPGSTNHKADTTRPVVVRWADKPAHNVETLTVLGIPDTYEVREPEPVQDDFPLSWNEILQPHGYTQCSETTWARPGKDCSEGISLSIPDFASYVITNFSSSDPVLPPGAGTKLTKLKLFALLNHGGDVDKAKKALPKRKLKLTPASAITPKPVHWLWEGRVALGTLALLAGREGIGKSTLAYTLVADITNGTLEGAFKGHPRSVIIVATEDSWEFTIVPRLMAAAADLTKVFKVEPMDEDEYGISLPRDIHELSEIAKANDTGLILLDPLMSRVDSKLDTHKDSEVRQALEPLVRMANDSEAAVLGLIHVNKSGSSDPLTSLMGSRAFSAVSRAVLYVVEDPDSPDVKVMGQPKNNLGRSDLPDLAYTLQQVVVGEWEGQPVTSVALRWKEERRSGTHRDLMIAKSKSKKDLAKDWLETRLLGEDKVPVETIREEGDKAGFDYKTLQRSLKDLNGESFREGGPGQGIYYWRLGVAPWELD